MVDSVEQLDAEYGVEWPLLPTTQPNRLDTISVSTVCRDISDLIVAHVNADDDIPSSPQEIGVVAQVLKDIIHGSYMNGAIFYALLASRIHFAGEGKRDPAAAQLWNVRAAVCEVIAAQLLEDLPQDEAAQYVVFAFYPLADGVTDEISSIPYWLRVSALELAIYGEAKKFLSHPVMVSIVEELWNGTLVFDPFIYKAHRARIRTRRQLNTIVRSRKGILGRYSPESISIFKPSRLRVPRYRHIMKLGSVLVLVALYLRLVFNWEPDLTTHELMFSFWALGFVLDEFTNLKYVGWTLYSLSLWSLCDLFTTVAVLFYWVFRSVALYFTQTPLTAETLNGWALNVLIFAAIFLMPRASSVLEANESFARLAISMRKLSIDLLYCVIAVIIFSMGFSASLTAFAKGIFDPPQVLFSQLQIFFGFTPAVWQNLDKYPLPGAITLFFYLFLAQFVVSTMVSAALNSRYRDISEHSFEEYHYHCAVRVQSKIKSEHSTIFFFAEPLNTLNWMLYPFQFVIPINRYLALTRLVLKITHMPVFICIYLYEGTLVRLRSLKLKQAEEQHERLKRYLDQRAGSRVPKPHIPRKKKGAHIEIERSMAPRTSKFDLVEEVLSTTGEGIGPSSVSNQLPRSPSHSTFTLRDATARRYTNPRKGSFYSSARGSEVDTIQWHTQRRRRLSVPFEIESNAGGAEEGDLDEILDDIRRQNKNIEALLEKIFAKLSN